MRENVGTDIWVFTWGILRINGTTGGSMKTYLSRFDFTGWTGETRTGGIFGRIRARQLKFSPLFSFGTFCFRGIARDLISTAARVVSVILMGDAREKRGAFVRFHSARCGFRS